MTSQNKFFDDMSRMMTNAMGVAQGAKSEAENAFNSWIDRWLAERGITVAHSTVSRWLKQAKTHPLWQEA